MTSAAAKTRVNWRDVNDTLLRQIAPRGKSLIMTVFGDAILPLGGGAWLGDLIGLLAPLGLNERMVRTSVYRLVQDNLLSAHPVGRRSYYALTSTGLLQSELASRRIYALRPKATDGSWTQVWLPDNKNDGARDGLARELTRMGFGFLTPDVMIHGGAALDLAARTIEHMELTAGTVVLSSRVQGLGSDPSAMRARVARVWPLDALAKEYVAFLKIARPVLAAFEPMDPPDPAMCFQSRVLLVHAYRRIVLKDPVLPTDLSPAGWPGVEATEVMRDLYAKIAVDAQRHVACALNPNDDGLVDFEVVIESRFCS
jgi:phenylacetic acid degradation operon negative regulatory protein